MQVNCVAKMGDDKTQTVKGDIPNNMNCNTKSGAVDHGGGEPYGGV